MMFGQYRLKDEPRKSSTQDTKERCETDRHRAHRFLLRMLACLYCSTREAPGGGRVRNAGHFAGVPPSSRRMDSYSGDWRSSRPATSRSRSTSSGGSTKLVGRFMK